MQWFVLKFMGKFSILKQKNLDIDFLSFHFFCSQIQMYSDRINYFRYNSLIVWLTNFDSIHSIHHILYNKSKIQKSNHSEFYGSIRRERERESKAHFLFPNQKKTSAYIFFRVKLISLMNSFRKFFSPFDDWNAKKKKNIFDSFFLFVFWWIQCISDGKNCFYAKPNEC